MKTISVCVCVALLGGCSVHSGKSIIFPAFDAPLVTDDAIFAYHTFGDQLVCLERNSGTVRWRIKTTARIGSMFRVDANRIAAVHDDKLSVIETSTGAIVNTVPIPGYVFGRSTDGNILTRTEQDVIVCADVNTGARVWTHQGHQQDPQVRARIADDLIFLSSRRTIRTHPGGESESVTMELKHPVVCLSAKNGTPLWSEPVTVRDWWLGVRLRVASNEKWALCTTDYALRLLERHSGRIVNRRRSEEMTHGADFWGDDRIAVCSGRLAADTKIIRILNVPDLTLNAEFTVDAMVVTWVTVVGDVMILDSLYRSIGVDLESETVIWEKGQRHYTVHDGLLYYG